MSEQVDRIVVRSDEGHFQGELYIGPVTEVPPGVETAEAPRVGGAIIVGHSETGHHHVVEDAHVRLLETREPGVAYLVAETAYADLVHKRDFDTHPTLGLEFGAGGGARKVVRQREISSESQREEWVPARD